MKGGPPRGPACAVVGPGRFQALPGMTGKTRLQARQSDVCTYLGPSHFPKRSVYCPLKRTLVPNTIPGIASGTRILKRAAEASLSLHVLETAVGPCQTLFKVPNHVVKESCIQSRLEPTCRHLAPLTSMYSMVVGP